MAEKRDDMITGTTLKTPIWVMLLLLAGGGIGSGSALLTKGDVPNVAIVREEARSIASAEVKAAESRLEKRIDKLEERLFQALKLTQ